MARATSSGAACRASGMNPSKTAAARSCPASVAATADDLDTARLVGIRVRPVFAGVAGIAVLAVHLLFLAVLAVRPSGLFAGHRVTREAGALG
jgi:hypothetical protein